MLFLRSNASSGLSFRFETVFVVYTIASVNEFRNYLLLYININKCQINSFRSCFVTNLYSSFNNTVSKSMLSCIILSCIILSCIISYCIILSCIILYCLSSLFKPYCDGICMRRQSFRISKGYNIRINWFQCFSGVRNNT